MDSQNNVCLPKTCKEKNGFAILFVIIIQYVSFDEMHGLIVGATWRVCNRLIHVQQIIDNVFKTAFHSK